MPKSSKNTRPIHGWINLDKPLGMSSAQAIGAVKRLLRPTKIGHAGTLDPLASGVLPLALGEATKTVQYMMDASKAYVFSLKWGEETTTDDTEGEVSDRSEVRPTHEQVDAILPRFTGEIKQVPPVFSAIKQNGKRAYALARSGEEVQLKSRMVHIYSLILIDSSDDEARFEVRCGKGTYIRSLARDMARALGTCGHVSALRRTQVGGFTTRNCFTLKQIEDALHHKTLDDTVLLGHFTLPVDRALDDIPAIYVEEVQALRLRQGRPIRISRVYITDKADAVYKVYCRRKLIALVQSTGAMIKPVRVFNM